MDTPRTQNVVPALRITQFPRSRAFYVAGLGFEVAWEHRFGPEYPVFMSITRDGLELYLTEHAGDCEVGGLVHLYVADVDAWYEDLRTRGIAAVAAPSETLPGLRDMTVVDPDGNKIRICTRLPGNTRST